MNTTNTTTLPASSKAITLSRQWVTPLLAGSFLLSAVTGILLFFKIHLGLIKPFHEWLSWILVIASVLHIILNYAPLCKTLTPRLGKIIVVIFALLTLGILLPLGGDDNQHGHGRPQGDGMQRAECR